MKSLLLLSFALVLSAGLSSSCESGKNAVVGTAAAATCTPAAGKDCLPKLTYVDIDGRAYTPEAMAGKIVVINFWATWCGPCKKEIPAFSKVAEKYKDKVVMLGLLASDNPDAGTLLNFMSDFEMTYPVVRATQEALIAYQYPEGLPTTFVYDRAGALLKRHVGPMSADQLGALIETGLKK
ncbi:MAG: TlpA family protein disulfide reductase [Kofleriaceae bacterium]|jgi:thiol-disulfide isomerase/thioredoxin|nr:TlpA family protein disulfide reductase [Kofleriaceae bacterium]MBP6840093.1 TlpA family protein disulfide reductase [Kofleriaceae bacterium]MBP9208040.1 TlpA family protein disulfide reductase [Kofleriaceae bacterium]